jgi:hypothetical protein
MNGKYASNNNVIAPIDLVTQIICKLDQADQGSCYSIYGFGAPNVLLAELTTIQFLASSDLPGQGCYKGPMALLDICTNLYYYPIKFG